MFCVEYFCLFWLTVSKNAVIGCILFGLDVFFCVHYLRCAHAHTNCLLPVHVCRVSARNSSFGIKSSSFDLNATLSLLFESPNYLLCHHRHVQHSLQCDTQIVRSTLTTLTLLYKFKWNFFASKMHQATNCGATMFRCIRTKTTKCLCSVRLLDC